MPKLLSMLEKVEATIIKYRLLEPGERVLVAVSGGPDSVALLVCLSELAPRYGWRLHVAYLNHQLRPAEAGREADFVAGLAGDLGWPVTVGSRDVRALARAEKFSLEDAARRARYAFLYEVAGRTAAQKIATGHQLNDQAETLLLHLLTGAGRGGLGGMLPRREMLIRPLLEVTRPEIIRYLETRGMTWCVDTTNTRTVYRRNKVRLELLPYLERAYNPAVVEVLGRTAAVLSAEDDLLEGLLEQEIWPQVVVSATPTRVLLDARVLAEQHMAWQRRVIRQAYTRVAGPEGVLGYRHVEEVRQLLGTKERGRVQLPRGLWARRQGSGLEIFRQEAILGPWAFCRHLILPGVTELPRGEGKLVAELGSRPRAWPEVGRDEAYIDVEACGTELYLRYWQPGDWFYPLGLGGRKKLQDFFTDAKVPEEKRGQIPILTTPTDIVWVVGWRLDARFRLTSSTQQVLYLRLVADSGEM